MARGQPLDSARRRARRGASGQTQMGEDSGYHRRLFNGGLGLRSNKPRRHFHHICEAAVLALGGGTQRLFQARFDAKAQCGDLGGTDGFSLKWCLFCECTVMYCNVRHNPNGLIPARSREGKHGSTLLSQGFVPADAECSARPLLSGAERFPQSGLFYHEGDQAGGVSRKRLGFGGKGAKSNYRRVAWRL